MTYPAASADLIQRAGFSRSLSRDSQSPPVGHVSTVINQPFATVLAHLRSVVRGNEGCSDESDPTLEAVLLSWGRHVCARYTVYEVPGGAQVSVAIEGPGHSRLDLRTGLAVRAICRRIAADLATMRDHLE